jgi:hypothetical protein
MGRVEKVNPPTFYAIRRPTDFELAPLVCGGARRITILRYALELTRAYQSDQPSRTRVPSSCQSLSTSSCRAYNSDP